MRVASITWNQKTGKAKIQFSEEFLSSDSFLRLDILGVLVTRIGRLQLDTAKKIFASRLQEKK